MTRYFSVIVILLALTLSQGCREDLEFRPASGEELRFSTDTLFLDTIFNGISSSTYSLKVYNTTDDDISIPEIFLENGENSVYRLNVNGASGQAFSQMEVPAKDSIYIFVEATVSGPESTFNNGSFLATDKLNFGSTGNYSQVSLVTLVNDAVFLFPDRVDNVKESIVIGTDANGEPVRIEGFELTDQELTFTSEKPYVIYGYAAVPAGKTMVVEAGARLHFHEASGIYVGAGGSIQINGTASTDSQTMENEVIFEGDRLEPEFSDVPGQWGTVWIAQGSTGNSIKHLTVKNAIAGIVVQGDPDANKLSVHNSRFLNSANLNAYGINTQIEATNSIFGSSGQAGVYLTLGGNYSFTHCTIANYWRYGPRLLPALLVDNYRENENGVRDVFNLETADFNNCIIAGNQSVEFYLDRDPDGLFNFSFSNSLLQFNTSDQTVLDLPVFDFDNTALYSSCLLNGDPGFTDATAQDFRLLPESEAIGLGSTAFSFDPYTDILGLPRDAAPDSGAHEYLPE